MEKILNKLWGNYGEIMGVLVRLEWRCTEILYRMGCLWEMGEGIGAGLWVDRGRSGVSDLNFRSVSGVEQLGVSAPLIECPKM